MAGKLRTAPQWVELAIREAGTTATGPVMLAIEDIMHEEMMTRQQSYARATASIRIYRIIDRLERMGIYTYSDVEALITEVTEARAEERPKRQKELRQALGM